MQSKYKIFLRLKFIEIVGKIKVSFGLIMKFEKVKKMGLSNNFSENC